MTETTSSDVNPYVYGSVRAVGIFKPKFNPRDGKIFSDELNVIGTAFWLKEYEVMITCEHVVRGLLVAPLEVAGLLVVGEAGNYRRAMVDQIDMRHDLAVLRVLANDNSFLSGDELKREASKGLELAEQYPLVGTQVAYAGFPLGDKLLDELHSPTYAEGVVGVSKKQDVNKKQVQISGAVVGGFSGSPVVLKEEQNRLVGVVSNGPQATSNIFMGIAWEHVKALAELATS